MTRVLIVSPFSLIGGGEISILTIMKYLDRKRFSLSLVCYDEGPFPERARASGIETVVIPYRRQADSAWVVWRLVRFMRRGKFDVVHVNSLDLRAVVAARLAGIPCIGHLRVIHRFTWRDRLAVRLTRRCLASSQAVVDHFCSHAPSLCGKFKVAHCSVDVPAGIAPADIRKEFGLPPGSLLVGAVGRVDPWKGYEFLIEAARLVAGEEPQARFFLVGSPDWRSEEQVAYFHSLQKMATDAGLAGRCFFMGFREDVLPVIAAFDIIVVPSYEIADRRAARGEGFGRVAAEAMAMRRPVIASASGGLSEIVIHDVTGYLVTPKDAGAISRAILTLARDPSLRAAMGKAGAERFAQLCSPQRKVCQIEDTYDQVIAGA